MRATTSGADRPIRGTTTRVVRLGLLACLMVGVSAARGGPQSQADIAVVVHPDVPADNLSLAELRRMLLGDREFWPSNVRVTLLIRAPVARERDVVVQGVCRMTEAQFRQHWIGKVFRAETPSGPKIVYSTEMALEQVSRVQGSITFVDASLAGKGAKVLKIEGRLPGQAGYPVR